MLMTRGRFIFFGVALASGALALPRTAFAEDTIKVGVLTEMSGSFAPFGRQITSGMKAYLKQHGEKIAGKKVELIIKDTTGPAPDVAKRLAQELVTRDKVQFLTGFS